MIVENTAENAERCACRGCPSYTYCMREIAESLYCAREKSRCSVGTLTCKCPSCEVWRECGLSSSYFCMAGAAL